MLSLVLILCVIGVGVSIRKWRKHEFWYYKVILLVCVWMGAILIVSEIMLSVVVQQNDTDHLQQQVDTLTEVNKQMENWVEIIEDELSDNPQLLEHVEEHLNEEIASNNEEIRRCKGLQEDRVPLYRWLLYFG